MGFLWALVTGDWESSLGVAVFLELFWLDLFPAGTYIPPHSVAATLLTLALMRYFGLNQPNELVLPLLLSLPMALVGSRLEQLHRRWQDQNYNTLIKWSRGSGRAARPFSPGRIIAVSLAQHAVIHFCFFCVAMTLLVGCISLVGANVLFKSHNFPLEWEHLWFLACLGGVLSLRVKRAYLVLGLCVASVAAVSLL